MTDAAAIPRDRGNLNFVERIVAYPVGAAKGVGSNIGSILKYTLVVLIIFSFVYLLSPVVRNYGPAGLNTFISSIGFAFTDGLRLAYQNIQCAMNGGCVTTDPSTDTKEYGVFITDIYTTQSKFRQWDKIVVKANARGELLANMDTKGCAQVECSLEDGTLKSKSSNCIPLRELRNNVIVTCVFEPMVSKDSNIKNANLGLIYNFRAETTLPISLVDASEYDANLDKYLSESESYSEAESKLASYYGVEMDPDSDPKRTPIIIGAKIDRNQPVPKGSSYTTLVISVQNHGGGIAKINEISVDLPRGIRITQSAEYDYSPPTPIEAGTNLVRSILNKDSLPYLEEELISGEFKRYDFALDTSGFPLENLGGYATTRKIYITVDYTYNTTSSRMVSVTSCSELGNCDTQVAESEDVSGEA